MYECDMDVIIKLIEYGADVNVVDNNGLTPLKHAVHSRMFKEVIQILIDNEDTNENDDVFHTSFLSRLYSRHVELAILLIFDHSDLTKSKEMLIILLDYFDVKNIFDITNNLPSIITAAIRLGMDIKMIQRLIDRGGNINHTDVRHVSPLLQSIKSKRDVNFIKEILEMGANVNEICDRLGNSILHIAVSNFCSGDIEVIKLLIDSGADTNGQNYSGEKPFMKFPLNADEDLWLELIKRGLYIDESSGSYLIKQFLHVLNYNQFTINTMNKICNRLLYLALNHNSCVDCITEIINNGVNVNEMRYLNLDVNDKALLIALKLNRDKEIISALIDNGADVNAIDRYGLTPLVYAINNNYTVEIINKLINIGANVNKCDFVGVTPLMYAIKNNSNEIIGGLINAGADVNAVDKSCRTILLYAVIYHNDQDILISEEQQDTTISM
ncbi:uncharacterized protein LOC142321314 [Lycorma delicatula]|uniref:uncharacterized protein LOC142321314 n=1 Tax=Lycorma delicatula TaxID=130591 RepID=UPI003F50F8C4